MKKAESVSTVLSLPYFYSIYKQQIMSLLRQKYS